MVLWTGPFQIIVRFHTSATIQGYTYQKTAMGHFPNIQFIISFSITTRRGSPVGRRPSTAEALQISKINPFSKMAVTFEPLH